MSDIFKNAIHPTILPISEWTENLTTIAKDPLEYCEGFPEIAKRYEAWWHQDCLDRPIFQGSANANPQRPITKRLEFLHTPERWSHEKFKDLEQEYRVGDTLPTIRVDFGPVMLSGLLGAKTEFRPENDTSWTYPFINDKWDNLPDWFIKKDSSWWNLLIQLLETVCEDASGRYLVCTPSLGGAGDVLLTLRGAASIFGWLITMEQIALKLYDTLQAFTTQKWLILLLVDAILLFLGCFIEGVAIMMISIPALIPLMKALHVDPVHFGVIMVITIMIGLITPPVGMTLYIVSDVAQTKIESVARWVAPFLIPLIISLLIITYWETMVLLIPRLIFR